jgi:hypothetical protein
MGSGSATLTRLLVVAGLALAVPAAADEWDNATDSDNSASTDNALFHGSVQRHDLGTQIGLVVDQDWFLMETQPFSSYEVVVDGQGGDLQLGAPQVQRMSAQGTVVQNASGVENPGALTLKFRRDLGSPQTEYVRVSGPACSTLCDLNDRYTIRHYDTTYTVPRFNNSGSQSTVLIVQNVTAHGCEIAPTYFRSDGVSITSLLSLPANGQVVIPTASVTGVTGQSGSIRLAHTCGYEGLSGKAVSIEPATGFTFDTLLVPRPH